LFSFPSGKGITAMKTKKISAISRKLRNLRRRRGQGMTEYIIIVGLIAIVLIGAVSSFGGKLNETFKGATTAIDNNVTKKVTAAAGAGGGGK
jgi:Flp pilus assembly pilin Flp